MFGALSLPLFCSTPLLSQPTNWKITSDSASIFHQKNQVSYLANAVFSDQNLTIKGDEILSQAASDKQSEFVEVKGRPAYLTQKNKTKGSTIELWANSVKYQTQSKTITALGQVRFKQHDKTQGTFTLSSDKFVIIQAKGYTLSASGAPLSVSVTKPNEVPIKAKADNLRYTQHTQQLELYGSATLVKQQSSMSAEKIFYNIKTGTLKIPKSPKRQLNLLQNKNK